MIIAHRDQCQWAGCCQAKVTRRYCRKHASRLGVARLDAIEDAEIPAEIAVMVVSAMIEMYQELPHILRGKVVSALSAQWRQDEVRGGM
jgi:hypothetical protein